MLNEIFTLASLFLHLFFTLFLIEKSGGILYNTL